jgi:hypothetical protein
MIRLLSVQAQKSKNRVRISERGCAELLFEQSFAARTSAKTSSLDQTTLWAPPQVGRFGCTESFLMLVAV